MLVVIHLSESSFISIQSTDAATQYRIEIVEGQERSAFLMNPLSLFQVWRLDDQAGTSDETVAALLHGIYACNLFANISGESLRMLQNGLHSHSNARVQ